MDRIWLTEGEHERLAACVQEPIRTPGSIQSHGALIVFDPLTLQIVQASENCAAILGIDAAALLGGSVDRLVGPNELLQVNPGRATVGTMHFDLITHRVDGLVVAEFEPDLPSEQYPPAATIYEAAHDLAVLDTINALMEQTALRFRALTGYDRVMVYRFHADGHGEVVAEQRDPSMEPYLGLHYPASDIPKQARQLYLTKLSRVIASSGDDPAVLLGLPGSSGRADDRRVEDLSAAQLRSVSPHHLEFMRNMGQRSTVSFSLVHDGVLIGMITCAHRSARRMPYLVRRALELMAVQVALHLGSMVQIASLLQQARASELRARLLAQFTQETDLGTALLYNTTTVLDLVPADGAVLVRDGIVEFVGDIPDRVGVAAVVAEMRRGGIIATNYLSADYPALAAQLPGIAGLMVQPIGAGGDTLAWFRRDVATSVNWLGDMTSANRLTALSPRSSFSSWQQLVEGRSVPWESSERDAAQLCSDLDSALLVRAESVLAAMALHDPLTGLPNRRLLMDRIDHALAKYARGEEICLLFIDLDRFKAVNDGLGHDTGDAVLVAVGQRILAATRTKDSVARLGGDEFVVLCEDTSAEEADLVAARILQAIAEAISIGESSIGITASIGVAPANLVHSGSEMLRDADAAMYRAKTAGRGRSSR